MDTMGDRIRKRRKGLGLSQGELGKRSGLGTATISGLELGTQHATTRFHKIAEVLGCRVEWLETGELPVEWPHGVREEAPARPANKLSIHDVHVSPDGAQVGAEWDKIEGDEYRQLAREFIEGLVAAQKRAARHRPESRQTTERKSPKNRSQQHRLE